MRLKHLLPALLAVWLCGCAAPPAPAPDAPVPEAAQALLEDGTLPDGSLRIAAVMNADVAGRLARLFEAKTGCSVTWAALSSREAEAVLKAQKGACDVDVLLGGSANLHEILRREGLLAPYLSHNLLTHIQSYVDKEGYWSPLGLEVFAIGVNPAAFESEFPGQTPPSTLEELADERYRGRLLLPDPDTSYSGGAWYSSVIQAHGKEAGTTLLRALLANAGGFSKTDLTAAQETGLGYYPLTVCRMSDQLRMRGAGMMIEPAPYPECGWIIQPVSLVAGCENPREGRAFIDFLLTREAGEMLGQQGAWFSTREDVLAPQEISHRLGDYPVSRTGWAYQNDNYREDVDKLVAQARERLAQPPEA